MFADTARVTNVRIIIIIIINAVSKSFVSATFLHTSPGLWEYVQSISGRTSYEAAKPD